MGRNLRVLSKLMESVVDYYNDNDIDINEELWDNSNDYFNPEDLKEFMSKLEDIKENIKASI